MLCRGHYSSVRNRKDLCPKIYPWVFVGYRPLSKYWFLFYIFINQLTYVNCNISGKEDAGTYVKIPNVTFDGCIEKCCESEGCNIVFMHKNDCFTVPTYDFCMTSL